MVECMLNQDFDLYMLFKCCIIGAVLKQHRTFLMSVNDPTDFVMAFDVICKTYSNFELLLINTFYLMDFLMSDKIVKPLNLQFSGFYVSSFHELRSRFVTACSYIQDWDTSVPRLKYNLNSFAPMLVRMKTHFTGQMRQLNFDDFILGVQGNVELSPRAGNAELEPSIIYYDRIPIVDTEVQNARSYNYDSNNASGGLFSSMFNLEETVSPITFNRNVKQDSIGLYIHQILHRGYGIRFLYVYLNGMVVFATKINDAGVPEKSFCDIVLTEKAVALEFKLRYEAGGDDQKENRVTNIDNYEGKAELKRFRIDVLEKVIIPLRSYNSEGEKEVAGQCDLEMSILLSYIKKIKLEDFIEYIPPDQRFMHIENYWGVTKKWMQPNYVEQNSLATVTQFEKIKDDFYKTNPNSEYCWATFDKFVQLNFDLVPLCKAMLLSIFYAEASISDKVNLLWETLVFFERLQDEYYVSDDCIESDSIQYFMRVLCTATFLSMPESAAENAVDYVFYGRIPSVRRALYISTIVGLGLSRKLSMLPI